MRTKELGTAPIYLCINTILVDNGERTNTKVVEITDRFRFYSKLLNPNRDVWVFFCSKIKGINN